MPNLLGKRTRDEVKTVGGPRFCFLRGAGVRDDEQSLQLQHGLLEACVTGFGFELRGMPKFERRERAMLCQRLPEFQRIAADAPRLIKLLRLARFYRCSLCHEEVRKKLEREKRGPALEIFSIKGTASLRELVLPLPDELGIFTPACGRTLGNRVVEGRERDVFDREEDAEPDKVDEAYGIRGRPDRQTAGEFVIPAHEKGRALEA